MNSMVILDSSVEYPENVNCDQKCPFYLQLYALHLRTLYFSAFTCVQLFHARDMYYMKYIT